MLVIEHGGIGDCIATAVALSAFHDTDAEWVLATRTWDIASLWLYLKPTWHLLFPVNQTRPPGPEVEELARHADVTVRMTPFDPRGLGNFYTARVALLAEATGLTPGALEPRPFRPITRAPMPTVLVHTRAAFKEKSMAHEEEQTLFRMISETGARMVQLPREEWTMGQTIEAIATAKAVIAVDSCMAHVAHWVNRKRLFVIHRDTDPNFLLPGMPDPPAWGVGFSEERIKAWIQDLI